MKLFFAIFAGLVLAAFPVSRAGAEGSAPTPCTGTIVTEPKGDESVASTALIAATTRRTGEDPNLDIRSAFVTYRDGKLTAHIQVSDLSKNVPAETGPEAQVSWWFEFATIGGVAWLKAVSDG